MGGMVSGAVSALGAVGGAASAVNTVSSLFGGGSRGSGSGSSGGGGGQQAQQPALCSQTSILQDSHNNPANSADNLEPVIQGGGLGSSFGSGTNQNNGGLLPTTYSKGGGASQDGDVLSSSNNKSPSLQDTIDSYTKMFCSAAAMPKWVCDKAEMLHYTHPANTMVPQGGLATIHQGGFGSGFDDGGKVTSSSDTKNVKFIPHSSVFDKVVDAIMPSVFKAAGDMKKPLVAPDKDPDLSPQQQPQEAQQQPQEAQQSSGNLPDPVKNFHFADGGDAKTYHDAAPEGHNPEFITGVTGHYAEGKGTGQSDDIPAILHDGDYVFDADAVSALGDGSSKAGREVLESFLSKLPHHAASGGDIKPVPARIADGEFVLPSSFVTALGNGDNKKGSEILDGLRKKLREHKRSASDSKIPPKAKDPIDYIKESE